MPINFFDADCETESNETLFGLCDDPPPAENPAYIDEADNTKWIAKVNNPAMKDIKLYAIDHCVTILRPNGDRESKCDGLLYYDNKLVFVELKTWENGGWLKRGREQLTVTLEKFKENHLMSSFENVEAYVCNKLKPSVNQGNAQQIQKFKDDTGLILYAQQEINV